METLNKYLEQLPTIKNSPMAVASTEYGNVCKWCKAVDGPFTTHNTTECRRFNKDGSQKVFVSQTKSFDSTKKPWKKPGSGNSDQISHLTEEMSKLKKRLKKSKKHSKKRARDSSDSDSDSS
jgi:hypothetical protein